MTREERKERDRLCKEIVWNYYGHKCQWGNCGITESYLLEVDPVELHDDQGVPGDQELIN